MIIILTMSLLYKIVWKLSGVFILFSGVLGVKASDKLKGNIIPQYNSIIISASTSQNCYQGEVLSIISTLQAAYLVDIQNNIRLLNGNSVHPTIYLFANVGLSKPCLGKLLCQTGYLMYFNHDGDYLRFKSLLI